MSAQIADYLERDETYTANLACVFRRFKQGKITDHMFCHLQDWLYRSALRRRGLVDQNGIVVRRAV